MQTKATKAYLYGALAGALAIASVLVTTYFLGKASYLGTSTTFVRAAGFIEEWVSPGVTSSLSYYIKEKVVMDWQFMLVIGIGLGAFISSMLNKEFSLETVPPVWRERFGSSPIKRAVFSFGGGVIAIFGARLADGCPSGHGLSGLMQLAVSSFIALGMFLIVGFLMAHVIYTGRKQ
jgi:hypothetical protein